MSRSAVVSFCVVFFLASLVAADQPAVTIEKPDQGSTWQIGEEVPLKIIWSNADIIDYTNVEIDLLDSSMDPFDYPKNVVEFICSFNESNAPVTCPTISVAGSTGIIDTTFLLRPVVYNFNGFVTVFVRANWNQTAGIVDALTQTLTIAVVPSPTPSKPPTKTPTKTPSKVVTKTPTPTPVTPTPRTPTPVTPTPKTPTPVTPTPKTPTPVTPTPKTPTPATPTPKTPTPAMPTPTPTSKSARTPTPTATNKLAPSRTPLPNPTNCPTCEDGKSFCCNFECVPGTPETHFCCETGSYAYSCQMNKGNCCGFGCCPLDRQCCGVGPNQRCCEAGLQCCGGNVCAKVCPEGRKGAFQGRQWPF